MADESWNPVSSRHEQKHARGNELREERLRAEAPHRPRRTRDIAWYKATHPRPTNTKDEYDYQHEQRYGAEEGMTDGKHRQGIPSFPEGSERDIAHAKYSESTRHRDRARKSYDIANKAHTADVKKMNMEERTYYKHSTDSLLPTQHADLSGRALDLGDAAWKNGSLRTDAEDNYPFGHHSLPQAIEHYNYAKGAFFEHNEATNNYNRHERHRSSEVDDGQRDCYGRRVTAGTRPHTRSRTHSLPPPGHYSALLKTPPGETSNDADYSSPPSSSVGDAGRQHRADTSNNKKQRDTDW